MEMMQICVNWQKWNCLDFRRGKEALEKELTKLLIPKDPQDDKNAIIELRAGTGGDEASLFVGDLLTMYTRYCQKKGWKVAVASESEGSVGGYKEVILEVTW